MLLKFERLTPEEFDKNRPVSIVFQAALDMRYEHILICAWANMIDGTEKLAKVFKALGDENRLGLVLSIGKEALSVTEIINVTGLSQTLVSFHLKALRDAEIVTTKRDGPFIYYSLSEPALMDILIGLSNSFNSGKAKAGK